LAWVRHEPEELKDTVERSKKKDIVDRLHGVFETSGIVIVARYTGMSVAETAELRRQMRAVGAGVRVAKNRLAKRATEGTPYGNLGPLLKGPSALAYSKDVASVAKAAVAYAKRNDKFVVVGGAIGATVLDAGAVKTLAELPSLDQLRAKLIGLLQAPATRIAGVLQAPAGQLARVINAHATKSEAA
jgi:large subunit ribosomal protein L10